MPNIIRVQDLIAKDKWDELHDQLYDELKAGIENTQRRRKEIEFQFTNGGFVHALPLVNFITNIKLWRNMTDIIDQFGEEHILDCSSLDMRQIEKYINKFIVLPGRKLVSNKRMNNICAEIIEDLKEIPEDFSDILGINLGIHKEVSFINKNARYKDLLTTPLTDKMTQGEIDEFRSTRTQEMIGIIKSDMDHPLNAVMVADEGISTKQFTEERIAVGSKPDGSGKIYPKTVRTNYMADGITSYSEYFVEATSGMNAKILSVESTGDAGYYSRQVNLLNADTLLYPEKGHDCGNKETTKIVCDNLEIINRLKYKYYKFDPSDKEWNIIKYQDEKLLGRTIYIRTAIDCKCEDDYVCWKCYGDLSYVNYNVHIGILAACLFTEALTQVMLSAKHLFTTRFEGITWSEDFDKICKMYANCIHVNLDPEEKTEIKILQEDYHIDSKVDVHDLNFFVDKFYIIQGDDEYEISNIEENDLYLTDFMKDVLEDNEVLFEKEDDLRVEIRSDEFGLFLVGIKTKQLSKTFIDLKKITNTKEGVAGHTYKSLYRKLLNLVIEGGIRCDAVHLEVIIKNMIRRKDDVLQKPDFRKDSIEDLSLVSIKKALHKNPRVGIMLAFDSQSNELGAPRTYERSAPSLIDPFFKPYIDDDNKRRGGFGL